MGFNILKEIVKRLGERYDNLVWMKNSEIDCYWSARELTAIVGEGNRVTLTAPFASPRYTIQVTVAEPAAIKRVIHGPAGSDVRSDLKQADEPLKLAPGTWCRQKDAELACFDLPKGRAVVELT